MKRFSSKKSIPFLAFILIIALPRLGIAQSIPERVDALLRQMTMDEKVGEMTQLTLQAVAAQQGTSESAFMVDDSKLREAIVDRHVGSILNVYDMAMTVDEWTGLITKIQHMASDETRLGIPIIYGIDAVHGNNYLMGATLFPQNIGMAATWNTDLVEQSSRVAADETRAVGLTWNFAPVLDLGRQPLWSRYFETYGEDVLLASEMGAANIRGQESHLTDGRLTVAATAKHYAGYSMPLSGKDRTPAWIPERMMREYFLPPFERAVAEGVPTMMVNSGEINGIPGHANKWLLSDVLRGEMGFDGVLVSDWEDIAKLHTSHHVAKSFKDATEIVIKAGIDMAMVPYDYSFTDALIELVDEGRITEDRIDESVRRILTLKMKLGLFQDPYPRAGELKQIGNQAAHDLSLESARESITLLKNREAILPLAGTEHLLLAGPAANSAVLMHGAWTYTWQGTDADAYPDGIVTLDEALKTAFGEVDLISGDVYTAPDEIRARAVTSDIAVLALGEKPSAEKPGDIENLEYPQNQVELVRTIAETGAKVVVVLFQNRPRIIRELEPYADAILLAYEPGPHGAEAVTEILTGAVNPSGRLPFTYPRYSGSIVPYDYKWSETADIVFGQGAVHPQYAFGFGLTYTSFAYSDLNVHAAENGDALAQIIVTVTNSGDLPGKEVVQLYTGDVYASITPSVRRLRAFRKIELQPGESRRVSFSLTRKDLSFIGRNNRPVIEPGVFRIMVGGLESEYVFESGK